MDLIHMNGRVYDPTLGRFMSADPNIDGMYSVEGFNRYSYVRNNPLKYTDPTGFKKFWKRITWKRVIAPVLTAVVTIVASIYTTPLIGGFIGSTFGGLVQGKSLGTSLGMGARGALYASFTAGLTNMIGHAGGAFAAIRNSAGNAGRYLTHALAQGTVNQIRFGDFK
ncbi:MAG: hypothetical protein D6698_10465, partial [Gammaproteobacteria bacterium]